MSRSTKPENGNALATNASKCTTDTEKETKNVEQVKQPIEIGGQKGPEPTRYGDWEKNGRCTDF